ncbi:cell division protein SepF [Streptomyces sp. TP-A0874]|uniref:cell division protein SepF n=1 Tax=Streptomyces sp. TP-A0874 TaxID=549819 RepID=UPI000853B071|nr:cell division protein SepF [Streptomyces sp. TP-A0874]
MNGHHDATDEQWEGLAQVVPLRGERDWGAWAEQEATAGQREQDLRQFVVIRVQIFSDARQVAENIIAGVPVLLDLTAAEPDTAKRVLDFSSGVVFGLSAGMHRVESNVFLLSPAGTEVEQSRPAAATDG